MTKRRSPKNKARGPLSQRVSNDAIVVRSTAPTVALTRAAAAALRDQSSEPTAEMSSRTQALAQPSNSRSTPPSGSRSIPVPSSRSTPISSSRLASAASSRSMLPSRSETTLPAPARAPLPVPRLPSESEAESNRGVSQADEFLEQLHDEFPVQNSDHYDDEQSQEYQLISQRRIFKRLGASAHRSKCRAYHIRVNSPRSVSEEQATPADILLVQESDPISIRLDPADEKIWEKFGFEVAQYVYLEDAFLNLEQKEAACTRITRKVGGIPDSDTRTYEADGEIKAEYSRIVSARRTSAHRQADTYLLRLARAGYERNGALMCNGFISHMIFKLFFNRRGRGGPRVSPTPDRIPSALIALIYMMLYFHMAKHSLHRSYAGDETEFKYGTTWDKMYKDYLYQRIPEAEVYNWHDVCRYHTDVIQNLQERNHRTDWTPAMATTAELRLYNAVPEDEPLV
ncbi:hypothetical protein BJV82DRAFT_671331 [Fennellomyces sp. T-0311]|nr:hypothetical protein BJV82DRAFT_671331 [Fennellomyces sp. T-0311]